MRQLTERDAARRRVAISRQLRRMGFPPPRGCDIRTLRQLRRIALALSQEREEVWRRAALRLYRKSRQVAGKGERK
jgi:hypothetical protein